MFKRVKFVPNSTLLIGCAWAQIWIWDTATGKVHFDSGRPEDPSRDFYVVTSSLSKAGDLLATGDAAGRVQLWEIPSGKFLRMLPGTRHKDDTTAIAVSPDGTLVVSGADSLDPTLRVWNVTDGTQRQLPKRHKGGVTSIDFAPDGASFVSAGKDGKIHVWDSKTSELLWTTTESGYVN